MHRNLNELPLDAVVAHGGDGRIGFHRLWDAEQLRSACHFVDYAVLEPGTSIGLHTHGDDEEIYLVLEGRGTMQRDGREFEVGPGSVIVNRPGGTHGLRNTAAEPLRLFVVEIGLAGERPR
jgi:mannose-6-phosphate isomerase-like protein (cupin superfamily)